MRYTISTMFHAFYFDDIQFTWVYENKTMATIVFVRWAEISFFTVVCKACDRNRFVLGVKNRTGLIHPNDTCAYYKRSPTFADTAENRLKCYLYVLVTHAREFSMVSDCWVVKNSSNKSTLTAIFQDGRRKPKIVFEVGDVIFSTVFGVLGVGDCELLCRVGPRNIPDIMIQTF
jgi:hypothetical protein